MTTLRVRKISLAAEPQVKIRIHKASLAVAAPVISKLRVHEAKITAVGAVIVTVAPAITVGPGEDVEIIADLLTPGAASWVWRRISGPTVGLAPDGDTVGFVAPSLWNPSRTQPNGGIPATSVLVLGVTATIDGVTSPEVRCEVSILPQLSWSRNGTAWVGSRVAPA